MPGENGERPTESGGFNEDGLTARNEKERKRKSEQGVEGVTRGEDEKRRCGGGGGGGGGYEVARGLEQVKGEERREKRERKRERSVLEIRLLHRAVGWEKPKALVTFLYVNLGRCTFRPGTYGRGPK